MHGKGWRRARTDYPDGIIAVYDLGAKRAVYERYTVVYTPDGGPERTDLEFVWCYLTEDGSYSHGSGKAWERPVSSWGLKGGAGAGNVIAFDALPVVCQRVVLKDMIPLCPECFCDDGQHYGDCSHHGKTLSWAVVDLRAPFVGHVEQPQHFVLRHFATHDEGARYIGELPGHALGLYGLDGPELPAFYECGCCGAYHSVEFSGDCREDAARLDPDDLDREHGIQGWVQFTTCADCGTPVAEVIGCPDGAEVCAVCFDNGNH